MKKRYLPFMLTLVISVMLTTTAFADEYWRPVNGVDGGQVLFDAETETLISASKSVTAVILPEKIGGEPVTTIQYQAFQQCEALTSITLPDSVQDLQSGAFYYCLDLTNITLGSGITTISEGLFSQCISLDDVVIPDSVTTIEGAAFSWCYGLTRITIPETVTEISYGAFAYCDSLAYIYYGGTQEQWEAIAMDDTDGLNSALDSATIYFEADHVPSDWAAEEVAAADALGLIPYLENHPQYTDDITRLQFAQLVVTMVEDVRGTELIPTGTWIFHDTDNEDVRKAQAVSIVSGTADFTYSPDNTITREQIAAMLSRAITYLQKFSEEPLLDVTGNLSSFEDEALISDYARSAMEQLVGAGILSGTSETTLSPQSTATVEQSISMIYRLYQDI